MDMEINNKINALTERMSQHNLSVSEIVEAFLICSQSTTDRMCASAFCNGHKELAEKIWKANQIIMKMNKRELDDRRRLRTMSLSDKISLQESIEIVNQEGTLTEAEQRLLYLIDESIQADVRKQTIGIQPVKSSPSDWHLDRINKKLIKKKS